MPEPIKWSYEYREWRAQVPHPAGGFVTLSVGKKEAWAPHYLWMVARLLGTISIYAHGGRPLLREAKAEAEKWAMKLLEAPE